MGHRLAVILALIPALAFGATQGPPAYVYTGAAPSGSCVGTRVWIDALGSGTYYCNAGTWAAVTGGGGAPTGAQYWTGAADGTLSAERNLGALATGLVLNTAGTPSAYAGATCTAPNLLQALNGSGAGTCYQLALDGLANPAADKTFTMANKVLAFSYQAPVAGTGGAFEIEAVGGFSGDLLHLHQHTGNPGAGTDLVHAEWSDTDVTGLRLTGPSSTAQAATITGAVDVTGAVTATTLVGPLSCTACISPSTEISATGTPSAATFLRGDNTWAAPPGGTGGGGNFARVYLNFGTGNTTAAYTVTGATWVTTSSAIVCSPSMVATLTRAEGAEDPLLEGLRVAAHSRVAGVGFTVTGSVNNGASGEFAVDCTGADGTTYTTALAVSLTADPVTGSCTSTDPTTTCQATTGSTTCSASGGSGSYSYAWSYVSGTSATANSPTSAATTFRRFGDGVGGPNIYNGEYRCTATDTSTGARGAADVTVTTDHEMVI